jgi:hypothetical protein
MTTMDSLRGLTYPSTYMPAVAGPAERRNVLLVESAAGTEGVAVHPFLLCQDWDQRVVIHWEDDHASRTFTVLNITADADDLFEFVREDEPAGTVRLTPMSYEQFEREYRSRDPEAGNVPRFENDEQFRRWFLPG